MYFYTPYITLSIVANVDFHMALDVLTIKIQRHSQLVMWSLVSLC